MPDRIPSGEATPKETPSSILRANRRPCPKPGPSIDQVAWVLYSFQLSVACIVGVLLASLAGASLEPSGFQRSSTPFSGYEPMVFHLMHWRIGSRNLQMSDPAFHYADQTPSPHPCPSTPPVFGSSISASIPAITSVPYPGQSTKPTVSPIGEVRAGTQPPRSGVGYPS